jgi:hypothetical protein
MNKKYIVTLTSEERRELEQMVATGKAAARKLLRAWTLLKADAGPQGGAWTDERGFSRSESHPQFAHSQSYV